MKSLVCKEPFSLEYQEKPAPVATDNEVVIKVSAVGICGTDIHAYQGNQPFFEYPRVLGHEVCGSIVALGSQVKAYKIGERVALVPYLSCGQCIACQNGKTNCCEYISVMGVHQDGGFSELLAIPQTNVIPIADNVDDISAALIEPFAISAHAVRRVQVNQNSNVLVIGAGPIGLGAAAIAMADGAKVVVADTSEERRRHIQKKLNVAVVDPLLEKIEDYFDNILPEIVIDATGNPHSMNNAVNFICHGGRIVFVGLFKGDLVIHDPDFHKKETTLMGSRNATQEDFIKVQRLMSEGKICSSMMLSDTFNYTDLADIYEEKIVKNKNLVKGVILY
ncbi:zinc-binding alcohol dehydrogenase family protein [Testudinibacter aquarius]|uniref:2-desacetyl-2-hydroxyethyl bacteriochlorophyllide A dehydrogenase n=1 Tax=Testudinibacter aquarius TaxID=1524974 RepID=A0A4R3YE43_9PAST|nr:zinc-binding alcohol dehydrogenase family protein [Testudinibacter aquarius]KAE9529820.1 galactonate oxidoreductase [Testudinibacter aquarius]TCV89418.1 2-desacetyl-2-hydroxyethyl bacteriochlorophyllide A dehydrogenase [Testudinibacter aquarius]TNG90078.1 zinc-binding alcohol dehydrogenase family protein [Testudinibacter aquarius]